MRRTDCRAVGRDRTNEEKKRRHIHGDSGARFSEGKYMVLLGRIAPTVTTFATKDCMVAEMYER